MQFFLQHSTVACHQIISDTWRSSGCCLCSHFIMHWLFQLTICWSSSCYDTILLLAVAERSCFTHASDFIRNDLHWLLVTQHIKFKLCTAVYKVILGRVHRTTSMTNTIPSLWVTNRSGLHSASKTMVVVSLYCTKSSKHAFALLLLVHLCGMPFHCTFIIHQLNLFSIRDSRRICFKMLTRYS